MPITSRRAAICQSVTEVMLIVVAPLGAVIHRFNFSKLYNLDLREKLNFYFLQFLI